MLHAGAVLDHTQMPISLLQLQPLFCQSARLACTASPPRDIPMHLLNKLDDRCQCSANQDPLLEPSSGQRAKTVPSTDC